MWSEDTCSCLSTPVIPAKAGIYIFVIPTERSEWRNPFLTTLSQNKIKPRPVGFKIDPRLREDDTTERTKDHPTISKTPSPPQTASALAQRLHPLTHR